MERFPPIEPFESGMVAVHGARVGVNAGRRRLFDPEAYLIVQFDQRGCGGSTPHAGDPATDLAANTTHHLIADMERLREHLGVRRWLLWGGSRGSPSRRGPRRAPWRRPTGSPGWPLSAVGP